MAERAISVLLQAVTGPYEAAMGRAALQTRQFGNVAEGAGKSTRGLGQSFGGVSTALLTGGGIALGVQQVASRLMEYETALVGVGKTTGLAGDGLKALGDDLTDVAMKMDGSAEDMLRIGQIAAQLGVENDNIAEFTEVIAGMATATDLTAEAAATDMARLSNILQRPIEEVESLGSTIVALGNNMATTEPEILSMATRLAAAGDAAGLTDAEILGLAASMSSLGLEAEAGGTALSRVLLEITNAAASGNEKLDVFASTARMSAQDFADAWAGDPAEAFTAFLAGLDRLGEAEQMAVLDELGLDAVRVSDALRRASAGSEGLAGAFDLANGAMSDNVALQEEVAAATDTSAVALDNLGDKWDRFLRSLGGEEGGAGLLAGTFNVLGDALDSLTLVVDEVSSGFNDMNQTFTAEGVSDTFARINAEADPFAQNMAAATEQSSYLASGMDELNAIAGLTPDIARDAGDGLESAADGADDLAGSADGAEQSMAELHAEMLAAVDPAFRFKRAQDAVRDAQQAYTDAVDEHGPKSREAEAAAWDLAEATAGADAAAMEAEGSFGAMEAQLDRWVATGRITAAQADRIRAQIREARDEAGAWQANSPYGADVRINLQGLDEFERRMSIAMGRRYETTVRVNSYVPSGSPLRTYGAGARARGGPVDAGRWYMVGESGPELVQMGQSGFVHDAKTSAAMMGGGAGSTTNVTVNMPPGASGDDVVQAIRRWEGRTGQPASRYA